jgi:hypothetical protein
MGGALLLTVDLVLLELDGAFLLQHRSTIGLLWLQTHFEPSAWDLICSGSLRLSAATRQDLCRDAEDAGLQLSCLAAPLQR